MTTGNWILKGRGRDYSWSGVGQLSIKSFHGCRALYTVGSGRHAVDDTSYLLLNHGQHYTIEVDTVSDGESFCLFFAPGVAEAAYRSLSEPAERLLDSPQVDAPELHFFERTYVHDGLVSPLLSRLRAWFARCEREEAAVAERFHEIAQALVLVHRRELNRAAVLPAVRPSTRRELYRRLHRARDYAAAMFDQPLTLDDLSGVACLSTMHFLRTFRQTFGLTPHQFVTSQRLAFAREQLLATDRKVIDICLSAGFQSAGSFSSLFRRRFGVSPEAYRKKLIFEKHALPDPDTMGRTNDGPCAPQPGQV